MEYLTVGFGVIWLARNSERHSRTGYLELVT